MISTYRALSQGEHLKMQMDLVQNLVMSSVFMNQKRKNLMHSILGVRDRCFIYIFLFYFILF